MNQEVLEIGTVIVTTDIKYDNQKIMKPDMIRLHYSGVTYSQ